MLLLKLLVVALSLGLGLFVSGCATYTAVVVPEDAKETDAIDWVTLQSKPIIRITTTSGTEYTGAISSVDSDNIVFQTTANFGSRIVQIEKNEVEKVEIGSKTEGGGLMAVAMVIGVILFSLEMGWINFQIGGN